MESSPRPTWRSFGRTYEQSTHQDSRSYTSTRQSFFVSIALDSQASNVGPATPILLGPPLYCILVSGFSLPAVNRDSSVHYTTGRPLLVSFGPLAFEIPEPGVLGGPG